MKEQNNPLVERKMNKLISDTLHLLYLQLGEDSLNISGLVRTALTEAYEAGKKDAYAKAVELVEKHFRIEKEKEAHVWHNKIVDACIETLKNNP